MNNNWLFDNNLTDYGILIGSGLILGYSLYYLIYRNYTAIPSTNLEPLTPEEIEAIINENVEPISNANIDNFITDSDFDTDVDSNFQSTFDNESIFDEITDPDLFFMPNVDLDVCSIQELKLFEISSIYNQEIAAHGVTEQELIEIIDLFSVPELFTNSINDLILLIITYYHG